MVWQNLSNSDYNQFQPHLGQEFHTAIRFKNQKFKQNVTNIEEMTWTLVDQKKIYAKDDVHVTNKQYFSKQKK